MNTGLAAIGGVLAIVVLVAVIVAYFRVNLSQATIDTLKESNAALTTRNGELDAELLDLKPRVAALERENEVLRSALGGKADVERIAALIEHHHDEVMADRRAFEERFTAAMVTVGERLDSNRRGITDCLNLLGAHRAGEST